MDPGCSQVVRARRGGAADAQMAATASRTRRTATRAAWRGTAEGVGLRKFAAFIVAVCLALVTTTAKAALKPGDAAPDFTINPHSPDDARFSCTNSTIEA